MPLGFLPFPGIDIFDVIKGPLITISGILLVVLLIRNKYIDKNIEAKLLYFFILLTFLASIFAIKPLLAFTGAIPSYGRYEGFITIFIYGVLFYAAKNYITITQKKITLFLVGMSIIGIYAMVQFFEYDPLVIYMRYPKLIFSTIGNQNFLASLMVMILPLPCAMYFWSNKNNRFSIKPKSLFYLLISFIIFSALIATKTRSTWIAFAYTYILSTIYFIFIKRKYLFHFFIISLTFTCSLFLLNLKKSESTLTNRVGSIKTEFKKKDEYGGSGRLKIWQITIKVIKKHPFLGVGPENLKPSLQTEFKKDLNEYWRIKGTTIDKAHNEYLHTASTIGIPALLILISIYFLSFRNLYDQKKKEKSFLIFIMITAYLIQATFNISVIAVAPVFWVLLGTSFRNKKLS
ncbi:MAG: O-antigen ligase family protein [Crocinitomicaceae bacterium]|nr:O-antigen ligase family protein [Crocinitomicaceae bacterium]